VSDTGKQPNSNNRTRSAKDKFRLQHSVSAHSPSMQTLIVFFFDANNKSNKRYGNRQHATLLLPRDASAHRSMRQKLMTT
jgi:hypothetical protein